MKKKTANRLEWVFLITVLISFIIVLSSCRSKETTIKTNTETKNNVSENTTNSIDRQINIQTTENFKESQSKELQSNQFEDLSITQNTIKYDTDKPIDPTTGKHPIKEETTTVINKQAKQEDKQSEQSSKEQSNTKTIEQRVKQLITSKNQKSLSYATINETKEKDSLSTIHKVLIAFGLLFLGWLGFRVYKWIKK